MIDLQKKQVEEFQEIYRNIYSKEISYEEAELEGEDMINFIALILENKY